MSDPEPAQSRIVLYQTEDGRTRIQCRFDADTLWLTQVQIAELFQSSVPNINLHLKGLYAEGELTEEATIKSYLIVRSGGGAAGLPRGPSLQPALADTQPRPVDADFDRAVRQLPKPAPKPRKKKTP